jgi:hypothetical protein
MKAQREMTARYRAEWILDSRIPLGWTRPARAEIGPAADHYFAAKHSTLRKGESCGVFCPLHRAQLPKWRTA